MGLLLVVAVHAEVPFGQGRLFRVDLPGQPSSYLFGTMHLDDARVVRLPPEVKSAFDGAGHVVLEIEMGPETMLASMSAMVLSDGRDLKAVIGDELYDRVVEAAAIRGLPEMAIRNYKPWAIMTVLSMPPPTTGQFLDMVLYQSAQLDGKPVSGLETVQEQIAVFESFSEADQIEMLRDTLDNQHHFTEIFEEMTVAYLQGDLAALMQLNEQYGAEDKALMERIQERLIDRRNALMVERMLPLLKQGRAFVAIGALHLPGERGVLSLLRGQGYAVVRVR
jgi:uncharacterized protein YbaP (TraB family)